LRPAATFCACVPPCDELLFDDDECEFFPPRLDAPGELAIFAARSFDMPFSFSASYCFSFFTLGRLPGIRTSSGFAGISCVPVRAETQTTIRRLGAGDADVVRAFATEEPRVDLLADERTIFFAAFDGERPVGFAFGYLLPRRHREPFILFVYEVDVHEAYRRRGIGRRLMAELLAAAPAPAFVLTDRDNVAANALYASLGGERSDEVMWDFPSAER
jgi:ribosomal protein S18 acetylase RimI-like enzyme